MATTSTVPIAIPRQAAEATSATRLRWIDNAKGIAIFLVVLGHTAAGLTNAGILPATPFLIFLNEWVYAFHVPMFFFISGVFALKSAQRSFSSFVMDKVKVIVYPYVLWTIIQFFIMSLASGQTNNELGPFTLQGLVSALLFSPIMEFWYLYVLFLIYILFAVVIRLTANKAVFLGITLVIFLIGLPFADQASWVVSKLTFSPLIFALGVYSGEWVRTKLPKLNVSALILGTVIGYGLVTIGVAMGAFPLALALLGIAATLCLSIILDRYPIPLVTSTLQLWGEKSLQIYVAHVIAAAGVRIILSRYLGFTDGLLQLLLGVIAGMYAPILLDWICEKIGFRYAFTLRTR